mgnify:CR=1 FL=1
MNKIKKPIDTIKKVVKEARKKKLYDPQRDKK